MKKLIAAFLLLPSLCLAAAGDYGIDRRNVTNNNWEKVLLLSPATPGILGYDPVTKLSTWLALGSNVQISGGVLSSTVPAQTWSSITGKPTLFSGAYADLTGKPALFDGAYSSLSGLPTLFSGAYGDLTGKPTLFSGAYADLSGKPTIPAAQVNADWNAVSGVSQILNKPTLFSGAYADLAGKPALFDGTYSSLTGAPLTFAPAAHTHAAADIVSGTLAVARIPTLAISQTSGLQAVLDSKFATPTGTTAQYLRGDGTVATFPSIPAAQANSDWNSVSGVSQILNKPTLFSGAYADLTGKPALFSGVYADLTGKPAIPAAQVNSDWNAASGVSQILNKPTLATVATTGSYNDLSSKPTIPAAQVNADWNASSGLAQILNKPTLNSGTVTSITAGTGLSGGVITTTGTISLPNTGTAGTYTNVTTDAQGRVTGGTNLSINDSPGRTLVTSTTATGFQISATRIASVCYEGSFSTTSTIGGPSSASVFLETADTNSTTASDWTVKATQVYSNNITLAIVLNQVQGNNWSMCRYIPAGKFVRIRSGAISGTASASLNTTQQEVLQ